MGRVERMALRQEMRKRICFLTMEVDIIGPMWLESQDIDFKGIGWGPEIQSVRTTRKAYPCLYILDSSLKVIPRLQKAFSVPLIRRTLKKLISTESLETDVRFWMTLPQPERQDETEGRTKIWPLFPTLFPPDRPWSRCGWKSKISHLDL